ncbi:MAG: hypothetical protein WCD52_00115 [Xanthobacteraceae bacterium]
MFENHHEVHANSADPILAAIELHRRAHARSVEAFSATRYDNNAIIFAAENEASFALAATPSTTPAGEAALLAYLTELNRPAQEELAFVRAIWARP